MLRLTTARWYTPVGRSIDKDREAQLAVIERGALTLTGSYTTPPESEPKPAFQTAGGRTVFGGGGIVPDVLVVADTLTSSEREALRELDRSGGSFVTTLFNYSVGYLQENQGLTQDFSLSAEDLAEFRGLMAESDVELSPSAFREAERFIRFQLEREIALKAWGDAGEFLRMLPHDRAMQRALQLLEASESTSDLLELSSDGRYSDWIPEPLEAPGEIAPDAMVTSSREGEGTGS